MTGRVFSINISGAKGERKKPVRSASLKEDFGILDDAHAGPGSRQVSLLAIEEIEKIESKRPSGDIEFQPGIFAENITTEDVDLSRLKVGDKLLIGEAAVLCVSQIGKECPEPCRIGRSLGECLMPKQGVFATVAAGGAIKIHDRIRVVPQRTGLWTKISSLK